MKYFISAILLFVAVNAYASHDCQSGTGINNETGLGSLCVECQSDFPLVSPTHTAYNIDPGSPGSGSACGTPADLQMTAHIAGYAGDGIHNCPGGTCVQGDVSFCSGGTNDGHQCLAGDCSNATFYPQINAMNRGTSFGNYDQNSYPPAELGFITNPAPHTNICGKQTYDRCLRWTKMSFHNDCSNGNFSHLTTGGTGQDDLERDSIQYGFNSDNEDSCTFFGFTDDTNDTEQTVLGCGWAVGNTVHGNDILPIQLLNSDGSTIDDPATMYCLSYYGGASITNSTWTPQSTADSGGNYPVHYQVTWQTFPTGTHKYDDVWEADTYITHNGGVAGWPLCQIEYDSRLNRN